MTGGRRPDRMILLGERNLDDQSVHQFTLTLSVVRLSFSVASRLEIEWGTGDTRGGVAAEGLSQD